MTLGFEQPSRLLVPQRQLIVRSPDASAHVVSMIEERPFGLKSMDPQGTIFIVELEDIRGFILSENERRTYELHVADSRVVSFSALLHHADHAGSKFRMNALWQVCV